MNKAIDRSAPVFRINHLVKEFGPLRAVDDVSAEIFHGEAVFIIGPSGSGKSTFLRCLNLLEEPTSGEILFKGRKINAPRRRSTSSGSRSEWCFSTSICSRT